MSRPCLLLAFLIVWLPGIARADRVEVVAARDNTLFEDANGDTSNGSGSGIFCGRISQGRIRRALVAFDLIGTLPDGARLDSASLVLQMNSSSDQQSRVLDLRRVLADWGEAGSASAGGGGAPAQPGDATWLHTFYPSSFWVAPGGDFAPTVSASLTVLGEGPCTWSSEALADDVRGWLSNAATNHGWILIGDESVPNTARRFDSREAATPETRPRLVLFYSPSTPTRTTSWGSLKARFRSQGGRQ